jgi:hypothetical protein
MHYWKEVLEEINQLSQSTPNFLNEIRYKYLEQLHTHIGRNSIVYYSVWLHYPSNESGILDVDMNSFMTTIHTMDKTKGLDLILHTP